jgi:hypothetical protein
MIPLQFFGESRSQSCVSGAQNIWCGDVRTAQGTLTLEHLKYGRELCFDQFYIYNATFVACSLSNQHFISKFAYACASSEPWARIFAISTIYSAAIICLYLSQTLLLPRQFVFHAQPQPECSLFHFCWMHHSCSVSTYSYSCFFSLLTLTASIVYSTYSFSCAHFHEFKWTCS